MNVIKSNKNKKVWFNIIALLLPIIILLVTELFLSIINYGGDRDLFVKSNSGRVSEYIFNEDFTKKYFIQKGIKIPSPLSQSFSVKKDSNTYRIFCLGASTTQGFPYPVYASYPYNLKKLLSKVYADKNIEVINCGITAITSQIVLDMQKEIIENYEPDLFIIYTGHNEFYGVLGQGSRLSIFENRTLLKAYLALQKSKLFLLTSDVVNYLFGKDLSEDPDIEHDTFMQLVAKERNIEFGGDLYRRTESHFENNVNEIIETANESETDILFCTLVSNKRDLPPFDDFRTNINQDEEQTLNLLLTDAKSHFNQDEIKESKLKLLEALEIDATNSTANYYLAKIHENENNFNLASKHYSLALDYDAVRFRAPSSFNNIIRKKCESSNLNVVEVDKIFEANSDYGLVGNDLLLEHVHPNHKGYKLIAKHLAEAIEKNNFIDNSNYDKKSFSISNLDNLTTLDEEIVELTIHKLMTRWPYNNSNKEYKRVGDEFTESLARSFVEDEKESFVTAHIKYADKLKKSKKFLEAIEHYKLALEIEPLSTIYNKVGHLYMALTERIFRSNKNYSQAENYFLEAEQHFKDGLIRTPDDQNLNFNLGLLYFMRNDRLSESANSFNKVLSINPKHQKALSQLSEVYFRKGDLNKTKDVLNQAIEYHPKYARYYTDLGLVYYEERNVEKAVEYLKKAIDMDNDLKAKYFLQQINNKKL